MEYVVSCANLIAFNLGIPEVRDEAQLNEFARSTVGQTYTKSKIDVQLEEKKEEGKTEEKPVANLADEDRKLFLT